MARIRIEDLPTVENLTPEEQETLLGAGRRSFQPTFEALEAREMMDIGLGRALLPTSGPGGAGNAPQVSHLQQPATCQAPPMQVDYGQLYQPVGPRGAGFTQQETTTTTGQDAEFVTGTDVDPLPSVTVEQTMPQGTATTLAAASFKDPLVDYHRRYVEAKDLRKGDFLLNTTEHWISNTIKAFSDSNYNHAAIYVGGGMVVEAIGKGVHLISLAEFLQDGHLERSMVIRHEQLSDTQRDAIAAFAIKQVGKPYNLIGVLDSGNKVNDVNRFDRPNYYCSQLVAASYSAAGVALHPYSLDFSPGELADLVSRHKLSVIGAVFDVDYHHAARDSRNFIAADRLSLLQHDANIVRAEAERRLANLLKNAKWTEGYVGLTRSWVSSITANNIEIKFELTYQERNSGGSVKNTTGTITINFSPRLNGTERRTGSRVDYLAHSPSLHDVDKGYLDVGRITGAMNLFVAQQGIQGSHLYDPNANRVGDAWAHYQEKLSKYIKERVGADLKTHQASVVDTSDGIILRGTFQTMDSRTVFFEFRMKFVGFADGQGQYVCVGTRERVGTIGQWNMSGNDFDTTKQASELMSPTGLAKQVFNDSKAVLSGQGFKDFRLTGNEYMTFGLRVRIQAQGADGKWQDFTLDVKSEGQRVYSCVRATNEADSVTPSDQHDPLLGALIKGVRNSAL